MLTDAVGRLQPLVVVRTIRLLQRGMIYEYLKPVFQRRRRRRRRRRISNWRRRVREKGGSR